MLARGASIDRGHTQVVLCRREAAPAGDMRPGTWHVSKILWHSTGKVPVGEAEALEGA